MLSIGAGHDLRRPGGCKRRTALCLRGVGLPDVLVPPVGLPSVGDGVVGPASYLPTRPVGSPMLNSDL